VVLNDDLKKDALRTTRELYAFLQVNPEFEPDVAVHNASEFPLSVRLQGAIGRRWHAHPLCPREPIRRRDRLHFPIAFAMNSLLGRYRTVRMRPETRRVLTRRFRDDVQKTAALIGRNLDSWVDDRAGR
jgi:hypothetical protein